MTFIDLSVKLRNGKTVKDGLHQYKKNVQAAGLSSVETVLHHFIKVSEERLEQATKEANATIAGDDEDLEMTPEEILLSAVSSEQTQDRTNRELVAPWIRFLWEAYRSTLDILRNNSKLEVSYHAITQKAFSFCFKYGRKTEFRRLCELLRNHVQNATQQRSTAGQQANLNLIDLNDPNTLQRYLGTRFSQLNFSVKLELWQEAFRSVEDVHTLLTVSKRVAKPSMMVNYYENLARIFLVSDNYLFHAAAWSRYFQLFSHSPNATEQNLSKIASFVLLSALSIPNLTQHGTNGGSILLGADDQKYKNAKLSSLMNLSSIPTRDSLIESALITNVLTYVKPAIKKLYKILEVDFHPLSIRDKAIPIFKEIADDADLKPYFKPLTEVILTRLLQQLGQVYKTVKLDFAINLAVLPEPFKLSTLEIEHFIVKACKKGELSLRIDHDNRSITFTSDPFQEKNVTSSKSTVSLQATPSEIINSHLKNTGNTLLAAVRHISYKDSYNDQLSKALVQASHGISLQREVIAKRRAAIDARKKEEEIAKKKKEEEAAKAYALKIQQEQAAEQQRIIEAAKKSELDRIKRERQAIRKKEAEKLINDINAKGIIKVDMENIEDLDSDKLKKMQIEQLAKDKKTLNERLRITGKRTDHLERAFRRSEIPLLEQEAIKQKEQNLEIYKNKTTQLRAKAKHAFEERQKLRKRLARVVPDFKQYVEKIEQEHNESITALRREAQQKIDSEIQKRREEFIKEFKARREVELKAKEEEERKKQASEEVARKKKESLAKLAEIQRQRDEEAKKEAERIAELERVASEEKKKRYQPPRRQAETRSPLSNSSHTPAPAPSPSSGVSKWARGGSRSSASTRDFPRTTSSSDRRGSSLSNSGTRSETTRQTPPIKQDTPPANTSPKKTPGRYIPPSRR